MADQSSTPGKIRMVTNAVIAPSWGRLMGIQIRHQDPGVGDAAILKIDERLQGG